MTKFDFHLENRAVLALTGDEAPAFLNRILTCNLEKLSVGTGTYGALLTPQGKILSDLFAFRLEDGIYLDLPTAQRDMIQKRLTQLKLRAPISITPRDDLSVRMVSNKPDYDFLATCSPPGFSDDILRILTSETVTESHGAEGFAHIRMTAVFPEFGADYSEADVFPADINMDLTSGIDFKKGCFVGQEVASRMKRKTEVRKRLLRICDGPETADAGAELKAGDSTIGTITSWHKGEGLALVRLDRLEKATEQALSVTLNETPVTVVPFSATQA